jgi:hypothetical protein
MRAKDRIDNEEPKWKKSSTDSENKEPSLENPITATEAPMREKVLSDKDEPIVANPSNAIDAAIREKLLRERDAPS